MPNFIFTKHSAKQFRKLDTAIQKRIHKKFIDIKNHPDIHTLLEPVINIQGVTHRIRIGDYRALLFKHSETEFEVRLIEPRGSIYKK